MMSSNVSDILVYNTKLYVSGYIKGGYHVPNLNYTPCFD